MASFLEFAHARGWDVVLLGATAEHLDAYTALGLRTLQVGVEAGRRAATQAGREARETASQVAREVSERTEDVADAAEKASRSNARRRNGG